MFPSFRVIAVTASTVLAIPCFADPSLECSTQASSQVEIGNCMTKADEGTQAALALALSFARQSAESLDEVTGRPEAAKALDTAQDAWTAYRDAHCEFVGKTFGGGSGTGIAILGCRISLTRERTDVLMQLAN